MTQSHRVAAEEAPLDAEAADGQQVADTFARLAVELHDADGLVETVDAVAQFALQALNCSYAGIVLNVRGRRPEVAAVTDPVVAEAYEMQISSDTGPLVTSLRERTTVLIRDTGTEDRWPEWAAKVAALGVRSVLDVPLQTGGTRPQTVGVLGLYSPDPDAFGADDEAIAHILARHASVAVATARHEVSMAQAVDARKLVGQAMGILMERFDVDGDRAFAILKRYSQDTNTKLRDVAQQLIDTRKLPADGTHAGNTELRPPA
ncbi:GAF domain-containing protein [Kribbella voronezhensis]|uniref:GAF domain-containing protein n=1 Tax=Kribbella voronezhensis TaxID=2512212 RepID=A0A4R7SY96_9ACTN|nr:GAF and ANTAR domain-containing protein [Kribbella voronezhensis]TDU83696.1 GAF domain-containing protein [Kribbella voronezhensis]